MHSKEELSFSDNSLPLPWINEKQVSTALEEASQTAHRKIVYKTCDPCRETFFVLPVLESLQISPSVLKWKTWKTKIILF